MKIRELFANDINRNINGVVQVAQNDEADLKNELEEYIITRELRGHFQEFFTRYENALDHPTGKIGVWISGFFGSGKSHFLKILSYLLSNPTVAGRESVDYFRDKFDDPMMMAIVERCAKVPTETILFNIDSEGPIRKDNTAILRVFAKVFYNHCGYYGEDLKLARLERRIDRMGKTAAFRSRFAQINGQPWESVRDSYAFWQDDIVQCLHEALGIGENAAEAWFNGEDTADFSIATLTDDIREYVESKGKQFRLIFAVDEIGQYIGSNGELMLNLQTIVEELGRKCAGKVWVMVTGQEAIDSITKISGDDFSKIQGRFDIRLSLSSSSVDEVIKKRILLKTPEAAQLLRAQYEKNMTALRNLFVFNGSVSDIKGYDGAEDYIQSYPFVHYQFLMMQSALAEIRKHGNSGKHFSGGERSMLSGFQETAQKLQEKDENALAPFYLFYDSIHTFLDSSVRRVIDRCRNAAENGDGLKLQDVNVLKLLFLIRYLNDIRATPENIAVLMIESVNTEKLQLKEQVKQSLDRLVSQNYVARNGDTYAFLTDDEQDITREIRNVQIDSAQMVQYIGQVIFNDLYPTKKYRYGKTDFAFDRFTDETLIGNACGGIRLRFMTGLYYVIGGEQELIRKSAANREGIVVLSEETPFLEEIESALKIRKYVKQRNVLQLAEPIQNIIRGKQHLAAEYEAQAKKNLESAIGNGRCYVDGSRYTMRGNGLREKLDGVLGTLVCSVYSKLSYIGKNYETEAETEALLNERQLSLNDVSPNRRAMDEVEGWLKNKDYQNLTVTVSDVQKRYAGIPYGWRETDIAAVLIELMLEQKISFRSAGVLLRQDDKRLPGALLHKGEMEKTVVERREAIPDSLMRAARDGLREWLNVMDVPADEDGLIAYLRKKAEEKQEECKRLLEREYAAGAYPQKQVIERYRELLGEVLLAKSDGVALLRAFQKALDELLDAEEDAEVIRSFFKTQREAFDGAENRLEELSGESEYLERDEEATACMATMREILRMEKPYRRISELPGLTQSLNGIYREMLTAKRGELTAFATDCEQSVKAAADGAGGEWLNEIGRYYDRKRQEIEATVSMTALDAMRLHLEDEKTKQLRDCFNRLQAEKRARETDGQQAEEKPKTVVVSRADLMPSRKIGSREEAQAYLEEVRRRMEKLLENGADFYIN